MFIAMYVLVGIIAAILSYGMMVAEWEGNVGEVTKQDKGVLALLAAVVVPLPFFVLIWYFVTGFAEHGLKFK